MSKLDELIERLCPDGVEYKKIGEIFEVITDYTAAGSFADIAKNVKYIKIKDYAQLIRTTDIKSKFIDENNFIYVDENAFNYLWRVNLSEDSIVMPNVGNCGEVYYVEPNKLPNRNNVLGPNAILLKTKKYNLKFLYYSLDTLSFKKELSKITSSTGQSKFNKTNLKELLLPVPPLEVQCEIVRILDNFTLLSAELSAELKARKGQFSYYRESLINSKNNITRLDDVVDIYLGLTHTPKYVEKGVKFISAQNTSKDYLDLENVKYISREEYDSITENAKPKKGDVLFTRVGSNLGHPVIVDTDEELCMFVSLGYLRIKDNNRVLNSYIKHWINTQNFWEQVRKYVHGSAKVNLNTGWLCKFEISIPSISEQKRIINILDKFEKLCNDISEGLPAEIESRRKQYEYYRDRLLTFKELKKEV